MNINEVTKGTKVVIETKGLPFLGQFHNQGAMVGEGLGVSGKTRRIDLTNGGSVYLTAEQFRLA